MIDKNTKRVPCQCGCHDKENMMRHFGPCCGPSDSDPTKIAPHEKDELIAYYKEEIKKLEIELKGEKDDYKELTKAVDEDALEMKALRTEVEEVQKESLRILLEFTTIKKDYEDYVKAVEAYCGIEPLKSND